MAFNWDMLATALADSPAVEAFAMAPNGNRCHRSPPISAWLSVRVAGTATICVRTASGAECHRREGGETYLGCSFWADHPVVDPPPEAAALLAVWPALGTLKAAADDLGAPSELVVNYLEAEGERARVALRTPTGWHTQKGAFPAAGAMMPKEAFAFDTTSPEPAWGLTSAYSDGCGNGGTTTFALTLVQESGIWLEILASRPLGSTSFSVGEDRSETADPWGRRLRARPAGNDRVRLTVAPGGAPGDSPGVDSDVGVWVVRGSELVRPGG